MDGFDSMFDMNRDGELDLGERALQMEFLDRAAAGDGDVDWDKEYNQYRFQRIIDEIGG